MPSQYIKSTRVPFGLVDRSKILEAIALPGRKELSVAKYARWATVWVARTELQYPEYAIFPLTFHRGSQ